MTKTTCFERWLEKNPGGTQEQFLKAIEKYGKGKPPTPLPNLARLPDGTLFPKKGITSAEVGIMTAEYVKNAAGSQ